MHEFSLIVSRINKNPIYSLRTIRVNSWNSWTKCLHGSIFRLILEIQTKIKGKVFELLMKIMTVFGTRPEAIKMAPVILELQQRPGVEMIRVSTSQHREMLDQVLDIFGIVPDFDMHIMESNQKLTGIAERALGGFRDIFSKTRPDLILVQGDTTSAFTGALAGFYEGIPVGHVEAGLRTWNIDSPYPEEANRRMISCIARYHFAPTQGNRQNLLNERIPDESILVTGNTVIDALHHVLRKNPQDSYAGQFCPNGQRLILVTAHRRENFGQPIQNICRALRAIAERNKQVEIVYPVHLNANVQRPVKSLLSKIDRVHLLEPVDYRQLCSLMSRSYLVLTDSGGIQEEAPSIGKPVLVMRSETERPEAVEAGTVKIVGTDPDIIIRNTEELLGNPQAYHRMAKAVNPYGDGQAARRITDFLLKPALLT